MAFKKSETPRALELTSLIDIVFLLLIFFLVSFAFSLAGQHSKSQVSADVQLPVSSAETAIVKQDKIVHLMFQVTADSIEDRLRRTVYVLWPDQQDTGETSRRSALERTLQDSTFATFPEGYLALTKAEFALTGPCLLISNSIAQYLEQLKETGHFSRALIEVRAEQSTEFRILNFIMEQCSAYNDDIPQLILRTRPARGENSNGV